MGNIATVWMIDTDEGTASAHRASLEIDSLFRDNMSYGIVYCEQ